MDTQKKREVRIREDLCLEIERTNQKGVVTARQIGPKGCSLVIVTTGDGIYNSFCGGKCSLWDRFLGRACQRGNRGASDGGVDVACTCRGGWWDSIFK